jgi:hypothetical protein
MALVVQGGAFPPGIQVEVLGRFAFENGESRILIAASEVRVGVPLVCGRLELPRILEADQGILPDDPRYHLFLGLPRAKFCPPVVRGPGTKDRR